MKKHITQSEQEKSGANQSTSDDYPKTGGHLHERFLTGEEFDALLGEEVSAAIDAELAVIAYERHLMRIARHHARQDITALGWLPDISRNIPVPVPPIFQPAPQLPPAAVDRILRSLRRARPNHQTLDQTARNRFNAALQQAYQSNIGQDLVNRHNAAGLQIHRMHTRRGDGGVGTQRFLPWHRLYLLKFEDLLRTYEPSVRIPYWDYANDQARPDWVWQPPNVVRGTPGAGDRIPCPGSGSGSLPSQQTVDGIVQNVQNQAYANFTRDLERNAHNGVHVWCNGTISCPETAAQDPIFWLLHANVDRIWDRWQLTNTGVPSLSGSDAELDPWQPTKAVEVDSVIGLGYWYS